MPILALLFGGLAIAGLAYMNRHTVAVQTPTDAQTIRTNLSTTTTYPTTANPSAFNANDPTAYPLTSPSSDGIAGTVSALPNDIAVGQLVNGVWTGPAFNPDINARIVDSNYDGLTHYNAQSPYAGKVVLKTDPGVEAYLHSLNP